MDAKRILIDCDAGVDDCQALLMALTAHARGEVTVVAITCVSGNVGVEQVVKNVRRCIAVGASRCRGGGFPIQEYANIPVFKGCHEPLVVYDGESTADATFWYGKRSRERSHDVDAGLLAAGIDAG